MKKSKYASMPPIPISERIWPSKTLTESPTWCAVDLRDGNQALPNPMTPDQKRRYFRLLTEIGFKEIEVGFPSASSDDYQFCRDLIEEELIPDDVTISVLTQARPHLIDKTIKVLAGVKKAVIHFYIATSELHARFVFGLEQGEVVSTAVAATRQIRDGVNAMAESKIGLQFSPEEFTDTDLDFTVEICDAVVAEWNPVNGEKVILNLPQTVERRLPNHYADMIEEFCRRQKYPDRTIVSVHNHNDMGCAVAASLQTLLAGAQRVEGTLFGHGERTGNVDLVTLALDLEYLEIDTGLDFARLPEISKEVEEITGIAIHPRHPYAGDLVFTAFSGSHQDAIRKGLNRKDELTEHFDGWKIPYLHVDPGSFGRVYDRFIRINSQSGKGGVAHVMETDYHVKLPRWVQIDFARHVQAYADEAAKEISSEEVWEIFNKVYTGHDAPLTLEKYWPRPSDDDPEIIQGEVHLTYNDEKMVLRSTGNGPISAFVHALKQIDGLPKFILNEYAEETMGISADAEAICFVRLEFTESDRVQIGVGIGKNIDQAAVRAVISGLNSSLDGQS